MRREVGSVLAGLVMLLGLAGCGSQTSGADRDASLDQGRPTENTAEAPKSAPSKRGTAVDVPEELRFTSETLDGDSFDGITLAGKDAVVWFWAPWCTECRAEAPHVAASQQQNPDVTFLGVAGLGEVDDMRAFVDDYDVGQFEHVADLDGSLWQRFGVVQQPAYAFIDDSGTVELFRGELGEDGLSERVAELAGN